jgi:vacuolar-type H+-ATPase subunit F/Vma7
MATCALLADEVTAAGFRLAGVEVHVAAEGDVARHLEELCERSPLVLVTAEVAGRLPTGWLQRLERASRRLVLVIADARGQCEPDELGARLRKQLGMAE